MKCKEQSRSALEPVPALPFSGRAGSKRALAWSDSIEVKIAERFFDGSILGLFEALGKFAREDVLFRLFGLDGRTELRFDGVRLLAQVPCRVVEVDRRRTLWRRNVREHGAERAIDG
jgi:hypothetical protein